MAKHGRPGWMLTARRVGARLGGLWLLLAALASCSGDNAEVAGPLVRLHLSPVDPTVTHAALNVTALDSMGQSVPKMTTFQSGPFDLMGVAFPAGTRGGTTYQVNLYSDPACLVATGQAALTIDSDGVFEVAVTLTAVQLCGNGATVTVQVVNGLGGSGIVSSTPTGINCSGSTTGCSATFMKGTAVTLTAQAMTGSFAGWSGAACPGLGSCSLTLSQDVQIQAVFTTCHGWCKEQLPFSITANLNGVTGTAVSNVVIVGDAGTVLHWDGTAWQQLTAQSGTTVSLRAAAAKGGSTTVTMAGDQGKILQLTGTTFTTVGNSKTDNLRSIAIGPTNMPITYLAGDNGATLSIANGTSSANPEKTQGPVTLYSISQNPNGNMPDLYIGGAPNPTLGLAQSWDGNGKITPQTGGTGSSITGNIYAMLCSTMFHYATGDGGVIIRRVSAGNNSMQWMPVVSPTNQTLRAMWSSSDFVTIIAVGDAGTIAQYDGNVWTKPVSGTSNILRAVWGSGTTNIYAVGDSGTILHYFP